MSPTNAIRLVIEQFLNKDPISSLSKEVGHIRIKRATITYIILINRMIYCNGKMFIITLHFSRSFFLLALHICNYK